MTAVDVLTAFSGQGARYESFFQYSDESRIASIEIHAVGMHNATARYSGQEGPWFEVNNILRLITADGLQGVSGVDTYYRAGFSDAHLQELEKAAGSLLRLDSLDPVIVSSLIEQRHSGLSNEARASIDIALWDLAARKASVPLYQMLGARRHSIAAYASLPFYGTLAEHIAAVHEYARQGSTAFKFHVWGSLDEDLRLVQEVQRRFAGSPYRFMIDLEGMYEFDDALVLGRQMDQGLFLWFEAPIDDRQLEQYAELRNALSTRIIPAGYTVYSPEFIRQGIELSAWDAGRFDATVVGGLSSALERLTIANQAGLAIDIQSWGHSLAQAANLHLMLANERTEYFEAPMPGMVFEFGMRGGRLVKQGRAVAPAGVGLGIDIDWSALGTADYHRVHRERASNTALNQST